jgi:hypothetical protein
VKTCVGVGISSWHLSSLLFLLTLSCTAPAFADDKPKWSDKHPYITAGLRTLHVVATVAFDVLYIVVKR